MIGTFMEIESSNISVYSPTKIDNYISFPTNTYLCNHFIHTLSSR